eukprot:TRINITY_DN3745_c3_g1_i1.p1 TRINITY_DN3745_c3_g1~~TRINITY_DN3745_c3_g1_i1.p1  ORF type:complete len:501 (+),score=133.50 TRINITY_DN3745_c3_g1_i1:87-1589(+)
MRHCFLSILLGILFFVDKNGADEGPNGMDGQFKNVVLNFSDGSTKWLEGSFLFMEPKSFNISSHSIINANPFNGCDLSKQFNSSRINGSIVFIGDEMCSFAQKVSEMSKGGALGIIIERFDYYGADLWSSSDSKLLSPSLWYTPSPLQFGGKELSKLVSEGKITGITMTTGLRNVWISYSHSTGGVLYQVLFGFLSIFMSLFCLKKFWGFVKFQGFDILSIPQAYLTIQFVGFLTEAIFHVDPLRFRNLVNRYVDAIFLTLGFAFHVCALFMLVFYWHEVLSGWNSDFQHKRLKSLKIPFIILSISLFLAEIGTSVARAISFDPKLFYGTMAAYSTILIACLIYTTYIGLRAVKLFLRRKRVKNQSNRRIRKLLKLWLMSEILIVLTLCCCFVLASPFTRISPLTQVLTWGLVRFFFNMANACQILTFVIPKAESSRENRIVTRTTDVEITEVTASSFKGDSLDSDLVMRGDESGSIREDASIEDEQIVFPRSSEMRGDG